MGKVKILNPWDIQSKHVHMIDGISSPIYSGECRWGGGEIYIIEPKNNTKINVLAVFEGNGCRPSHQGFGLRTNDTKMYTLNGTEVHGVIYELSEDDRVINGK